MEVCKEDVEWCLVELNEYVMGTGIFTSLLVKNGCVFMILDQTLQQSLDGLLYTQ